MDGTPQWAASDRATRCTGGAAPGTLALARAVMEAWGARGVGTLGIYNCRDSSGGGGLSIHAEGRAWDASIRAGAAELGYELLGVVAEQAAALGVQRVIWDRKQYDRAWPLGAPYRGPNPHTDHLHIEQNRASAAALTYAAAVSLLGGMAEEGEQMVILSYSDVPGDTAVWLLVGSKRLYLEQWANVQALKDAGAAHLRLPRAVISRLPLI